MSTKIGLISDVHASVKPVIEAMDIFKAEQVSQIFCAGDIAGYGEELEETIEVLEKNNCLSVKGNHEDWYLENLSDPDADRAGKYFNQLTKFRTQTIEGKSIYIVHAHPPDKTMGGMRLLDKAGELIQQAIDEWQDKVKQIESDILIIGHTHQVFATMIGSTLVINPGSSIYNHSCAILQLPEMKIKWCSLSAEEIEKTWNWSDQFSKK